MIKYENNITNQKFDKGLCTFPNFFNLTPNQTPDAINVKFNIDYSMQKRLGTSTMNSVALESTGGYGMYDFGATLSNLDSYTKLLMHFDNGDTNNFIDELGHTVTPNGGAAMDSSNFKFGTASGTFAPVDSYTKLLLHLDNNVTDTSYNVKTVTNTGVTFSSSIVKFGGYSGQFDGISANLSVPDDNDWYFGTSDFTIDFWARFNISTSGDDQNFVAQYADASNFWAVWKNGLTLRMFFVSGGSLIADYVTQGATGTDAGSWHHYAFERLGTTGKIFVDGIPQLITETVPFSNKDLGDVSGNLWIGSQSTTSRFFNGNIDEVRISKGIARWSVDFSPQNAPYHDSHDYLAINTSTDWYFGTSDLTIDFWANANTFGGATCFLSSSASDYWSFNYNPSLSQLIFQGVSAGVTTLNIAATSVSVSTGQWHHFAVVRSSNVFSIYQDGSSLVNITTSNAIQNSSGKLLVGQLGNNTVFYNGFLDELRVSKGLARWATNFTPPTEATASISTQARRLVVASGTGIYYSSDLGKNFVLCQTSRTASVNHFSFVKDYVVNTNDAYDKPMYWAGSSNSYFAYINTAAPACKYSIAHQGYLVMLNESANKNRMYYVDQGSMFTSPFNFFPLPTEKNDELQGGFVLRNFLYLSSKYRIFRLIYVGGYPDWSYVTVKNWGFVGGTIQKINIPQMGEIAIGLDWTKRIRVFDGLNDEIISTPIELDNGVTPFCMENIDFADIAKSWSENDIKEQIYRLYVAYAGSGKITHCINYNYRIGALYVDNNRNFQSGVLAQDAYNGLHMVCAGYNGYIYHQDSGNTDSGSPINEHYTSPYYYAKNPASVQRLQQIDLFFNASSSGTVYLEENIQMSKQWNLRMAFTLTDAGIAMQDRRTIDVPTTCNEYQFRLSSSSSTAEPWQLNLTNLSQSETGVDGRP